MKSTASVVICDNHDCQDGRMNRIGRKVPKNPENPDRNYTHGQKIGYNRGYESAQMHRI